MSWHDNLIWADDKDKLRKKASFRGALFFISDTATSIGRRNTIHQYPFQDEVYVEDLGMDTDEFQITGYVVQDGSKDKNDPGYLDYFTERDALVKALKKSGQGLLIHPFLGEKMVSLVGKAGFTESMSEGGIARFDMTFVLANEKKAPYPKPTIDYINAVDDAVVNVLNDAIDGFFEKYDPDDVIGSTIDAITDATGSLNTMMRSTMRAVQGLGPAALSRAFASLSSEYLGIDITQTCATANSLVGMFNGMASLSGMYGDTIVSQLFGGCSSAIRGISSGPMSGAKVDKTPTTGFKASTMSEPAKIDEGSGKTSVAAAIAMCRYGETSAEDNPSQHGGTLERKEITTASTARESANLEAIINIVRLTAITTAAKTAIRIDYSSYDSAMEVLRDVINVLDTQLLKLGNDAVNTDYSDYNISISDPLSYEALQSLRPIFVEAMEGVGADLARIIDYKIPPAVLSSLVLSYNQYGVLDREQEIIDRNTPFVKHPGFLPMGEEIEVLSE